MVELAKPFPPKSLAEHWSCSERHIRNLIEAGEIPCFRLGKLVRIPAPYVRAVDEGRPWREVAQEEPVPSRTNARPQEVRPYVPPYIARRPKS